VAKKDDLDIFGGEGNTQPNPTNSQFGGFVSISKTNVYK